MGVSAGANIGERLMGRGERHYELLRETALRAGCSAWTGGRPH